MNLNLLCSPAPAISEMPPFVASPAKRILYVEDDDLLRTLVSHILDRAGYRVELAEDGQAGWEVFQLGNYDLVITDNDMPRLTGVGLVKRLRAAGYTVPVVMASGSYEGDPQMDAWLQLTAILGKPFTLQELQATVAAALQAKPAARRDDKIFFPILPEPFNFRQPAAR